MFSVRKSGRLAVTIAVASGMALLAAAGCGGGGQAPDPSPEPPAPPPTPGPRADLAARAAAAQDLVAANAYTLQPPSSDQLRPVLVVRAADGGWRVDISGGALGGTADLSIVRTEQGLFQCGPPGCVRVDELPPAADPRVQHVFTDWLDVLRDRSAPLSVSAAEPLPGADPGDCFAVQPSAASLLAPVDAGVYCYRVDGTLTAAQLGLGNLTLTSAGQAAPGSVELPGPVITGEPIPTASPTPSPTPSEAPSERPSPGGATP
ncbi:MAG TPA: hypothetical protein VIL54_06240 [Natronosporangium sp.]